jgi:hypothetical protein
MSLVNDICTKLVIHRKDLNHEVFCYESLVVFFRGRHALHCGGKPICLSLTRQVREWIACKRNFRIPKNRSEPYAYR